MYKRSIKEEIIQVSSSNSSKDLEIQQLNIKITELLAEINKLNLIIIKKPKECKDSQMSKNL